MPLGHLGGAATSMNAVRALGSVAETEGGRCPSRMNGVHGAPWVFVSGGTSLWGRGGDASMSARSTVAGIDGEGKSRVLDRWGGENRASVDVRIHGRLVSERGSGDSNPRAPAVPNGGEEVTVAARRGDVPSAAAFSSFL